MLSWVGQSRSRFDLFKQVVDMQFTDIQVLIRTNPDFTGTLLEHGKKAYEEIMATEYVFGEAGREWLLNICNLHQTRSRRRSALYTHHSTSIPSIGKQVQVTDESIQHQDTDLCAIILWTGKGMEGTGAISR